MKKILEVIDQMISLSEAFTPAQQVFNDIEKHFIVGQRTPIQRKTWIHTIEKRMSKKNFDPSKFAMVFARQMEQGNFLKKGVDFKKFKDVVEKAVKDVEVD